MTISQARIDAATKAFWRSPSDHSSAIKQALAAADNEPEYAAAREVAVACILASEKCYVGKLGAHPNYTWQERLAAIKPLRGET